MNKKQVLAAFICLCLTAVHAKADVWTLDQTVRKAVEVSNQVDIQKLNAGIADLDAESAVMGWYPAVSLTAGANIVSDVMEISMPFKDIRTACKYILC